MLCAVWPSSTFSHLPECIGLSLVSCVEEFQLRVGICLNGTHEGKFIVVTTEEEFTTCDSDIDLTLYMFERNPFGLAAGTKCLITVNGANRILRKNDWGMTMTPSGVTLPLVVNVVDEKKRCNLKRAEMPDGTYLTSKDTLALLAKWLDVQNAKFASKYGLEQLVWAEVQNSSRASVGGQVRGWFRHDIADGGKRKVCPHASSAIEHMQKICKVNFYDDIKTNGNGI